MMKYCTRMMKKKLKDTGFTAMYRNKTEREYIYIYILQKKDSLNPH